MGLYFVGGERIQRGRGIGGLLRMASKLFFPVAKVVKKVLKSDTGRKIVNAVKDQAINSSLNIVNDLSEGKNIKESLSDEFKKAKQNSKRKAVEIGTDFVIDKVSNLKKKRKKESGLNKEKK